VIVVIGHEGAKIETALKGLDVHLVRNPDYALGLSASLKAGIRAVPASCDGAIVLLGDMPEISTSLIDRMIAAFSPPDGRSICVAAHEHRRGNPVLWSRRFFTEIEALAGDTGAKELISLYEDAVYDIEAGGAVLRDIDTPDALAALRGSAAAPA
jgi:molybdenum cofactor cytidylyltransferase